MEGGSKARTSFDAPGDSFAFRDVISTLDAGGQNLTGHFVLSADDKVWWLSPDGTKAATYREVYDLSAGTVTPLAMGSRRQSVSGAA